MLSEEKNKQHDKTDGYGADQIALVLQGIRFGSIEIVIHDGKVVQIERREKLRFDAK